LYAYNHNVDTSEEHYKEVISTRGYDDRLQTIENARNAKLTVCSGGIIGLGEKVEDRVGMLLTFSNMETPPESIPINALVAIEGTPLEDQPDVPIWDMVRMIATTRIVIPESVVRLSAGRAEMSPEGQALCFMAGASSIFAGDKLLTTPNPDYTSDKELFNILGLKPKGAYQEGDKPVVNEDYKNRPENPEKIKWSRPGHKIEANERAKEDAKHIRASEKSDNQEFNPRKFTSVDRLD